MFGEFDLGCLGVVATNITHDCVQWVCLRLCMCVYSVWWFVSRSTVCVCDKWGGTRGRNGGVCLHNTTARRNVLHTQLCRWDDTLSICSLQLVLYFWFQPDFSLAWWLARMSYYTWRTLHIHHSKQYNICRHFILLYSPIHLAKISFRQCILTASSTTRMTSNCAHRQLHHLHAQAW